MIIRPSTAIRDDYNEIADLCKSSNEPIFLTQDGVEDLVVMSVKSYKMQKDISRLNEMILQSEQRRLSGEKTYSVDEAEEITTLFINEKL